MKRHTVLTIIDEWILKKYQKFSKYTQKMIGLTNFWWAKISMIIAFLTFISLAIFVTDLYHDMITLYIVAILLNIRAIGIYLQKCKKEEKLWQNEMRYKNERAITWQMYRKCTLVLIIFCIAAIGKFFVAHSLHQRIVCILALISLCAIFLWLFYVMHTTSTRQKQNQYFIKNGKRCSKEKGRIGTCSDTHTIKICDRSQKI